MERETRSFVCETCHAPFTRTTHPGRTHRFCSRACWYSREGKRALDVACEHCGKAIRQYPSDAGGRGVRRYCSRACRSAAFKGQRNPLYKGRWINHFGYVVVRGDLVPDAFTSMIRTGSDSVLEHRLVMAQKLGRPLGPREVVHHVNGDKTDNRPENLELHGDHAHVGVTNVENIKIAALKREVSMLRARVAELESEIRLQN